MHADQDKDTPTQTSSRCESSAVQRLNVFLALAAVILLFGVLELLVPIRTTVQIGADEGFELAKATLCLKGYKLYTDVWNDHAPLHTFLITQLLKHISPSVAGPRLLTVGFAMVLIGSIFFIALRLGSLVRGGRDSAESVPLSSGERERGIGLLCGVMTGVLVIASPGFLELSSSCMLEIPALAPALAALCFLYCGGGRKWYLGTIVAGVLFGISLGMKLIGVVLLPIAALFLWAQYTQCCVPAVENASSPPREKAENSAKRLVRFLVPFEAVKRFFVFSATCAITFIVLDLAIDRGAFLRHFHQSWMSHFAPTISAEYGSPNDHRFPFILLLKNWDMTIPATIGIILLLKQLARHPIADQRLPRSHPRNPRRVTGHFAIDPLPFVPVAWLAFALAVFTMHKPWWTYYYVHMAIPLSLCAGFGLAHAFQSVSIPALARSARRQGSQHSHAPISGVVPIPKVVFVFFAVCTFLWMGSRAYLEISGIRTSPQTYYCLVLNEIDRFKPFTQWIYTDNLAYSFYSRIPMPPQLAVTPLKRLWSGEMTNAGIRDEMQKFKPGLIALRNDTRETPFQELLNSEYRLVYQDPDNRLYAHKTIANKPDVTTVRE